MRNPYLITVKETLAKDIIVYADTWEEAVAAAKIYGDCGEISMTEHDNFYDVDFMCQGIAEDTDFRSRYVQVFDDDREGMS